MTAIVLSTMLLALLTVLATMSWVRFYDDPPGFGVCTILPNRSKYRYVWYWKVEVPFAGLKEQATVTWRWVRGLVQFEVCSWTTTHSFQRSWFWSQADANRAVAGRRPYWACYTSTLPRLHCAAKTFLWRTWWPRYYIALPFRSVGESLLYKTPRPQPLLRVFQISVALLVSVVQAIGKTQEYDNYIGHRDWFRVGHLSVGRFSYEDDHHCDWHIHWRLRRWTLEWGAPESGRGQPPFPLVMTCRR